MNKDKRIQISAVGESVRALLKLVSPISTDSLQGAVRVLGGEIKLEAINEGEASIVRKGEGFLIRLDPDRPRLRKVFSIAHELGHLFLHMRFGQPQWQESVEYV